MTRWMMVIGLAVVAFLVGCQQDETSGYGDYPRKSLENFQFVDDVSGKTKQTSAEVPATAGELAFVDTDGNTVTIGDYVGKSNIIVVFTRGFTEPICPFCQTQTSRLISNYERFRDLNAEVLLVYPGKKGQIEDFLKTVKTVDQGQIANVPFKILLDDGLEAVRFFGIEENRAYPATFIFDTEGRPRFSYVGRNPGDRPSIKAILEQLQLLST